MSSKKNSYKDLSHFWRNPGVVKNHKWQIIFRSFFPAALLAAAFPTLNFWPLAFVAFAVLSNELLKNYTLTESALYLGGFSFFCNLIGFYWISYTLREFGNFSWFLSVPITLIFFLLLSFVSAFYGFIWAKLRSHIQSPQLLILALALFYCFWDRFDLRLFPWSPFMALGSQQYLLASVGVLGNWGWRILFFTLSLLLFGVWRNRGHRLFSALSLILFFLFLLIPFILGSQQIHSLKQKYSLRQPVAILQGNIGNFEKRTQMGLEPTTQNVLRIYETLIEEASIRLAPLSKSDENQLGVEPWYFWPETALPAYPMVERDIQKKLDYWANLSRGLHLIGSYHQGREKFHSREINLDYNITLLLHESAGFMGFYKKQLRLAFGEYFPGDQYLEHIYEWVPAVNHFGRGYKNEVLLHPDPSGPAFVSLICYEVLSDSLVTGFIDEVEKKNPGRDIVLYNPTNDSWFGASLEPFIHARLSQWQAARVAKPMVRATNTGISMVIAPWGEVLNEGPLFKEVVVYGELPVTHQQRRLPKVAD
jgi:apolipoprotein N-acyltransferase